MLFKSLSMISKNIIWDTLIKINKTIFWIILKVEYFKISDKVYYEHLSHINF